MTEPDQNLFSVSEIIPMRQLQDSYINWVMIRCHGDKEKVAELLKISEKTLYNRIRHGDVTELKKEKF
jgi:DNA-binding NtrC family response regulator